MLLKLWYDRQLHNEGIPYWGGWDYTRYPHGLIIGGTGSGKTFAEKLLLGRIANHVPGAEVTLCDYKAEDFHFLAGHTRHYEFTDCTTGLNSFFEMFQRRQSGEDPTRDFRLLVFDEWGAYCSMLEKKEAESAKAKLGTLLMLGRAFNIHVIICQQRADASYFSAGARDQFAMILAMGNLSREAAQMFGFDRELMLPAMKPGEGHALLNGSELTPILIPLVQHPDKLNAAIGPLVGPVVAAGD